MFDIPKHKVFISYHHDNDEEYKKRFVEVFGEILDGFIDKSVEDGDIDDTNLSAEQIYKIIRDEYIKDSTVTIVLIGIEIWRRKHIDWEIATSLWNGLKNKRNGLLGILLPTYHNGINPEYKKYNPCTIPPRLYDNIKCGYAKIYEWTEDVNFIIKIIHEAYERRFKVKPDNSRERFKYNKPYLVNRLVWR